MKSARQLPWMLLLLIVSSSPLARDKDHFAIKLGSVQHEDPAYEPAINLNLTVGGKLLQNEYAALGLQLEMNTSVIEGNTTSRQEWELDSHALYGILHLGETHYLKLKAGYIDWQVRYDLGANRNGTGFTWGAAYGFPLNNGHYVELEYTMLSDKQDFGMNFISLGYYF